jgi:hypothetical protein
MLSVSIINNNPNPLNNSTAAVIIPVYKSDLSALEQVSLVQCFKMLSNYDIVLVKPETLEINFCGFDFHKVVSFEDRFFLDIKGYNELMLTASFYEKFLDYKFILIHQLDAFVFKDELLDWCAKDYDYIGAPWLRYAAYPDIIKKVKNRSLNFLHLSLNLRQSGMDVPTDIQFQNRVGNGGFSLRKTKRLFDLCNRESQMIKYYNSRPEHYYNEDAFWGLEVNRRFTRIKIPKYKEAVNFSIENSYKHAFHITGGKLPFGCHAWDKHLGFWRPIFAKAGVII